MKHTVFFAKKENIKNNIYICAAIKASKVLEGKFFIDNEAVAKTYHSGITVAEDFDSPEIEIYLENEDIYQLIEDCMAWAVLYSKNLETEKSVQK